MKKGILATLIMTAATQASSSFVVKADDDRVLQELAMFEEEDAR